MRHPLLMLPRPVDQFVLGDHARELIEAGRGVGVAPGRVPYGALLRAPGPARPTVTATIARGFAAAAHEDWEPDRTVLVAYHAIQWPVAHALLERGMATELWYCRWDRYEAAQDAGRAATLLGEWHEAMAGRSDCTFAVSGRLAELEREAGRDALVVGLSADDFPDGPLEPGGPRGPGQRLIQGHVAHAVVRDPGPVAVSLGHLGYRTDWAWLRGAVEAIADLELLLIGAFHEDEAKHDDDFHWLRASPQVVWLGSLPDDDAAAVIAEADVGLVPFKADPFNDAGLPTRILKYARLGRPTLAPPLAGARTWSRAVTEVATPAELAEALRGHAGARSRPDAALRAWALEQTAARMNAPLHERLRR